MQIACVKAVRDPPVALVQHSSLRLHRPITRKGPMIESQSRRSSVETTLVQYCTAGRREVLGPLIADIVFRRLQAGPIGGSFRTLCIDRNRTAIRAGASGFGQ